MSVENFFSRRGGMLPKMSPNEVSLIRDSAAYDRFVPLSDVCQPVH